MGRVCSSKVQGEVARPRFLVLLGVGEPVSHFMGRVYPEGLLRDMAEAELITCLLSY